MHHRELSWKNDEERALLLGVLLGSYRLSIQGITGLLATGTMICSPPVMPDGIGTGMLNTRKPPKLAGAVRRMMLRRNSAVQSALRGALHGVAGRIKNS
jgi:hypothetical protein